MRGFRGLGAKKPRRLPLNPFGFTLTLMHKLYKRVHVNLILIKLPYKNKKKHADYMREWRRQQKELQKQMQRELERLRRLLGEKRRRSRRG